MADDLSFDATEEDTGGTKRPTKVTLHALHPEHGPVGSLEYHVPRRKADKIFVENLTVHEDHRGKGYGSQLMDEMQRRHPNTPIEHGDRTTEGQAWWDSYTKGKSVRRGRTIEGAKGMQWVHVTPAENRDSIIERGIRMDTGVDNYNQEKPGRVNRGIYVTRHEDAESWAREISRMRKEKSGTYSVFHVNTEALPKWTFNGMGIGTKHGVQGIIKDHVPPEHVTHLGDIEINRGKSVRGRSIESARQEFYHGTTVEGVTHILPASKHRGHVTFPHDTDREHAYASTKEGDAWDYAEKAWHASGTGVPRVYKVHPMGPHEKDPQVDERGDWRGGVNESDVRSKHGFAVLHEVPMPEHMGDPEDWR